MNLDQSCGHATTVAHQKSVVWHITDKYCGETCMFTPKGKFFITVYSSLARRIDTCRNLKT